MIVKKLVATKKFKQIQSRVRIHLILMRILDPHRKKMDPDPRSFLYAFMEFVKEEYFFKRFCSFDRLILF